MPAASQPPPQTSSGALKYVLLGLIFLGGTFAVWLIASKSAPPAPPPPGPPAEVARVNPMAQPELELAPEVPDAGVLAPEPVAKKPSGPRRSTAGGWECSGELRNADATKVVNDNRPQVRSCYERRLKINNVLQGDLRLRVKVGSTGKVVASSVAGSLHDEEVFSCVRTLAQSWTFPVPSGGNCAVVSVPFHFTPKP